MIGLSLASAGRSRAAVGDITTFTAGHHSGAIGDITLGPDGNLWFTQSVSGGEEIGRITPEGAYTHFGDSSTINPGAHALPGITLGSDGNLWFTEIDTGDVGRITPTGTITEFELTNSSTSMSGIESGPDGNLWLAENTRNMIGRLPTTGSGLAEFGTGITAGRPQSITTGPDGNLWFNEFSGPKIGRITTGGAITEFSSGTRTPADVAAGPDGNIWFTEFSNGPSDYGRIGRIGTDGTGLTEFNAGLSANPGLGGIVAGPDGNLWFTEQIAGKVARITPSGVITEFSAGLPLGSQPDAITVGPDGNIWFGTGYGISRVITSDTPPPPSNPTLTVSVGGNGSGTVTGSGISCPATCSATYPAGTQVTLTPTPAEGSTFAGWSGACTGTEACNPTVNGATFVAADFASAKLETGAKVGKKKVKVRNGHFTVSILNGNGVPGSGSVTFTGDVTEVEVKKPVKLGQEKFSVPAQGAADVKVKLAKKGVRFLKTHKSLKAKAKITLTANGTSNTSTQKITLLAGKK